MEVDEKSLEVIEGIVNRTGLDDAEKRNYLQNLRGGVYGYGINLPISGGTCPVPLLHVLAAENKSKDIVLLFFSCPGVDVNVRNRCGFTPLHVALARDCTEAALALMECRGVDINAVNHSTCWEYVENTSPLHIACRKDNATAIKALLEHGANIFHGDGHGSAAFIYCKKTLRPLFKDAMKRAIES